MIRLHPKSKQAPCPSASRTRCAPWLLPLLAVLVVGCIDPVEPAPVITWQGALEPTDVSGVPVSGSVAMVANAFSTQMGIGISAGPEEGVLRWTVRSGTCEAPGDPLAALDLFPVLLLTDTGTGQTEFVLNQRIAVGGDFTAQVLDANGRLLACGNLIRQG